MKRIKNWEIPKGKKTVLSFHTIDSDELLSVRLKNCLKVMKIFQLKDACIPNVWYASNVSWSTIILNQPNLGRKAYNEFVEYLIYKGLVPIYADKNDDSDDSMTGGLMK